MRNINIDLTVAKERSLILAKALLRRSKKKEMVLGSKYAKYKMAFGIEKPGSSMKMIFSKSRITSSMKSSFAFESMREGYNLVK
jgi:hypothetical protein